jgi:hypothetical protein
MATHIVVNPDLITYTTLEKSFLDVSGEPAPASVKYTVFTAGATPQTATVTPNARNFATSPDLFALAKKKTALVVAVTSNATSPSAAVLHQHLGGNARASLSVPSSNHTLGKAFNIPISDLAGGGTIFIGNPNTAAANIAVQNGASNTPAVTELTVGALSVGTTHITQAESNLIVTSTNNVPVIVQIAIGPRFLRVFPIGPAV